jgi:hypothetical protein
MTLTQFGRTCILAGSTLCAMVAALPAQQPTGGPVIKLGRNVIVSPEKDMAYVADPKGGTRAVDLVTGQSKWVKLEIERPLTVTGSHLIGLSRAADQRLKALDIVALERRSGEAVWHSLVNLPEEARPSGSAAPDNPFAAAAQPAEGEGAIVTFNIDETPERGQPPGADVPVPLPGRDGGAAAPAPRDAAGPKGAVRGRLRLDAAGKATPLPPDVPVAAPAVAASVPAENSAPRPAVGSREVRIPSADDRHYIVVEARSRNLLKPELKLGVYDNKTGKRVGQISRPSIPEDYVVEGSRLLLLSPSPAAVSEEDETIPVELRAIDLNNGIEPWKPVLVRTDPVSKPS